MLPPEAVDQGVHVQPDARVQGAKGFVQQKDAGPADQGLGDGQPLLHAARELRWVGVTAVGKADLLQHLPGLLQGGLPAATIEPAQEHRAGAVECEGDIVDRRQMGEDRVALEDDAPLGARLGGQGRAIQEDVAAGRGFLADDQTQEGALPGPGGSDDGDEAPARDVEADLLEDDLVAVLDPHVSQGKDGIAHAAPFAWSQGKNRRLIRAKVTSIITASRDIQAT